MVWVFAVKCMAVGVVGMTLRPLFEVVVKDGQWL